MKRIAHARKTVPRPDIAVDCCSRSRTQCSRRVLTRMARDSEQVEYDLGSLDTNPSQSRQSLIRVELEAAEQPRQLLHSLQAPQHICAIVCQVKVRLRTTSASDLFVQRVNEHAAYAANIRMGARLNFFQKHETCHVCAQTKRAITKTKISFVHHT